MANGGGADFRTGKRVSHNGSHHQAQTEAQTETDRTRGAVQDISNETLEDIDCLQGITHSLTHSFIHSFIYACIHSFIHSANSSAHLVNFISSLVKQGK